MDNRKTCQICGHKISRFESHTVSHCAEYLMLDREKLALTLGHVYMAISKLVADPPGDDTAILIDIMTTIDKVLGKDGK